MASLQALVGLWHKPFKNPCAQFLLEFSGGLSVSVLLGNIDVENKEREIEKNIRKEESVL